MKSKKYLLFVLVMIAVGLSSCLKDSNPLSPTVNADFTFSVSLKTVNFTSTSSSALTYEWDFDDGGSAYTSNPTHVYSTSGIYSVSLTVTGLMGGTSTKTKIVTIL